MSADKIVIIALLVVFMIGGFILISKGNKSDDHIENQGKK